MRPEPGASISTRGCNHRRPKDGVRTLASSMRYAVALAALTVVCLVLVGEAAIPGAVGTRLEKAMARSVDEVESIRVYIRTFPALAVAFGRVDLLRIDARNVTMGGLRVQRLFVDVRHADVDVSAMLRGERVGLRRVGKGDVTVILAESDLNAYLHSRDGILRALAVKLRPGVATVAGHVNVLGIKVDIVLDGRFVVEGGMRLRYVVDRLRVGNAVIPEVIKDELMGAVDLSVDVSGLPVPVVLREVNVQDGVVYVFGGTPATGD